jgi:hypothetical protein
MPWTAPNTAVAGNVISAADHNTYLRDNLIYLFSQRPSAHLLYAGATDYTTSSASFVPVDTTNLRLTATVNSGRFMALAYAHLSGSTSEMRIYLDLLLDSTTRAGGASGVLNQVIGVSGSGTYPVLAIARFTGLATGSHTFDLVWRTSGVLGYIRNIDTPVTMLGWEF